ncbi:MAG: hypothetical protein HAW64_05610, partial [Alphaproteobacteria bacterium]|nr:hypothetical protein [Alphaproteobacteria bacterium]
LIFAITGRVPARGEIFAYQFPSGEQVEFVIRDGDPRHIKTIDIKIVARPSLENEQKAQGSGSKHSNNFGNNSADNSGNNFADNSEPPSPAPAPTPSLPASPKNPKSDKA